MPTVFRVGAYRLFFYASDRDEPQHIHVEREDKIAKFWLDPIRLRRSDGFNRAELSRIHKIIREKPGLSENAYMGLVMREFKGKISGKEAIEIIKKYVK